jgi:hypothetical protein
VGSECLRKLPLLLLIVVTHKGVSSFLTDSVSFVYPETKDDLEQLTTEIKKRANNVRNKLKSKIEKKGKSWSSPPSVVAP